MTIALPKPGSDRYKVLALIVAYPGELGTKEIAAHLWPPVKLQPASMADLRCVRCAWPPPKSPTGKPWPAEPPASLSRLPCQKCAQKEQQAAAETRVWRMIGQLGEKGLVCACGGPVLSAWFLARLTERKRVENGAEMTVRAQTVAEAIRRASPAYPGKVGPLDRHIGLVEKLRGGKLEAVADLIGKRPGGQVKAAYSELCKWGVIVPPSYRWATADGIALVQPTESADTPLRLSSRLRYAAAENPDVVLDSVVAGA